jgi:hypothetical protein
VTSTIYRPRPSFWKLLKAAYYQRFAPQKLQHVRFVPAEILALPDGTKVCLEVPTQVRPSPSGEVSPLPMPGPGVVVHHEPRFDLISNVQSFDADFGLADEFNAAQAEREEKERAVLAEAATGFDPTTTK